MTDMAVGPITITCPGCGDKLPVPARVVYDNRETRSVLVRMDYTGARAHFRACRSTTPTVAEAGTEVTRQHPEVPHTVLAGRVNQLLDGRHYIVQGKRACVMCGAANNDCLTTLDKRDAACCAGCHNGDTHPVPQQDKSCAEWAADREATQ